MEYWYHNIYSLPSPEWTIDQSVINEIVYTYSKSGFSYKRYLKKKIKENYNELPKDSDEESKHSSSDSSDDDNSDSSTVLCYCIRFCKIFKF